MQRKWGRGSNCLEPLFRHSAKNRDNDQANRLPDRDKDHLPSTETTVSHQQENPYDPYERNLLRI